MLIAGRREPKTGLAGRQARARIVIRAGVLLVLGSALTMVYGDVIILAHYGIYFLLSLPLLRLGAGALAAIAAGLAVIAPQLAYVLKTGLGESFQKSVTAYDPLESLSGTGLLDLLLTGLTRRSPGCRSSSPAWRWHAWTCPRPPSRSGWP